MTSLIAPLINFIIFASILYFAARKPAKAFLQARHDQLKRELSEVRDLLHQAQDRYEDFSMKLKNVQNELRVLQEQSRMDAQETHQRILARSKEMSAMIVKDAHATAKSSFEDLRSTLSAELGVAVLGEAEAILKSRLTGEDRIRIQRDFSVQVGGVL